MEPQKTRAANLKQRVKVDIYMEADEYRKVKAIAQYHGTSISKWIRSLVLEQIEAPPWRGKQD